MKKKKYSDEEILDILNEEKNIKDIPKICLKYEIHYTTFYRWKNIYLKIGNDNRNNIVNFKLNDKELKLLKEKCKSFGCKNDVSHYIRKVLFSKHIAVDNPHNIVKELYKSRTVLNKAGSNINQIANYTNFLLNQGYLEEAFVNDLHKNMSRFMLDLCKQKEIIDKTLIKI